MSDTAATPETGANDGPLTRTSDVENALEGVLGTEDYPDSTDSERANEAPAEAEAATEVADVEIETEASDEAVEQVEERQPRRYRVKANGEEREVTFDELKQGYQMGSDYRQKTEKLAEERREMETQRQRYEHQLDNAIPALQQQAQGKFANVDWVTLAQEDPAEYTALRAEFDQYNGQLQMAMAEKQYLEQQRVEEHKVGMQELLQSEHKRLLERYPVFGDPEKGKEVRNDLKGFLRNEGYSDDDLNSLSDSRSVGIAYKAMLYDKAQKGSKKARVASKDAPPVQKAGTPVKAEANRGQEDAAAARLRKSGKTSDLEDWLSTQSFVSL